MKVSVLSASVGLIFSVTVSAAEKWVDQSAAPGGNGSSNAPYQTISAAITAAATGDTVTVRNGTYREMVRLKSGTQDRPFTLQAAPGAAGTNVVISGFKTLTGWTVSSGQVYSVTTNWVLRDLYAGFAPQRLSRYPDMAQPWLLISAISADGMTFTVTNLPLPVLSKTNSFVAGFESADNSDRYLRISSVDPAARTITLTDTNTQFKVGDPILICNDPALITEPGEWAYEPAGTNSTRFYFWPKQTNDLSSTQCSNPGSAGPVLISRCSNVLIQGLEVAGQARDGSGAIYVSDGSEYVTIRQCVVHDNRDIGIYIRGCSNVKVSQCVILRSYDGLVISGSHRVVAEDCEIAFNFGDGVNVIGDTGAKLPEYRNAEHVTLRRCYIHHQQYLEHPDGVQIFSGLRWFRMEDSVCLYNGQALMTQECDTEETLTGCVLWGTSANNFQGHTTDTCNWIVQGNMFGFAGWSLVSMPAMRYWFYENIVYGGGSTAGSQYQGDRNVYWMNGAGGNLMVVVTNGHWVTGYTSLASFVQATTQDVHSVQADPDLANVPISQGYMSQTFHGTVSNQFIAATPSGTNLLLLATNDLIEVNGDGVARTVTQIAANSVYFTPPLPVMPFRNGESVVSRWGTNTNFQLDTRSNPAGPAANMRRRGGPAGSLLVVSNFQSGDFNGDGVRDLPPIPAALQAAWPDPNDPILPCVSPF